MIKTLENVANSDTRKSEKEKEFNIIANRAFEFYEKLPFVQLDPLSKKRVDDAFLHVRDIITTGYKDLKSGIDVIEYRKYEDDETIEAIIDKELLVPKSVLDQYSSIRDEDFRRQAEIIEPLITDTVNLSSKDNLPIELQVDFEDTIAPEFDSDDDYDYEYDIDAKITEDLRVSEINEKKVKERFEDIFYANLGDKYYRPPEYQSDSDDDEDERQVYITYDTVLDTIYEEEEQDLEFSRKPSNYPYNVLTDENSIQPTSIENSNMAAPRMRPNFNVKLPEYKPAPKFEEEKKPKRKRPLGLRLYQEFLKLMRKYDPSLSRADITELWRTNKDAYTDMLMETVDLSGGNLLNPEHYFNAFRNIGGVMLGGSCCDMCEGGELGNKYYQMKHADTGFDRTSYDKVNNPYGIGKTHADELPRLPQVGSPLVENTLPATTTPTYSGSDIDMTDLSDPRAWGKTFENIASGVYGGLKDVYKILSPLSWIL